MSHIVVFAATALEIAESESTLKGDAGLQFVHTGIGQLATTYSLMSYLSQHEAPRMMIMAGIAGSFDANASLGDTIVVGTEALGSCGVQEHGEWRDVADLSLRTADAYPYIHNKLSNPNIDSLNRLQLPVVNGVTVDEISTDVARIETLQHKYSASVESMEGAALHYVGLQRNIPFIQMRGISNYVGERDKSHWKMKLAIDNLNAALIQYVRQFS